MLSKILAALLAVKEIFLIIVDLFKVPTIDKIEHKNQDTEKEKDEFKKKGRPS